MAFTAPKEDHCYHSVVTVTIDFYVAEHFSQCPEPIPIFLHALSRGHPALPSAGFLHLAHVSSL